MQDFCQLYNVSDPKMVIDFEMLGVDRETLRCYPREVVASRALLLELAPDSNGQYAYCQEASHGMTCSL